MDLTTVEVGARCPFCGGFMEIVEDDRYLWFGCRSCMRYVKREKRDLVRRYVNYGARIFDWRGLMAELSRLYETG